MRKRPTDRRGASARSPAASVAIRASRSYITPRLVSGTPTSYGQNIDRPVFAPLTPLLGRSTAEVRRASRDIGQSPHDAVQQRGETARRCLCLDDCAQRGSAQRIRKVLASRSAHRTESTGTNTPLSLTLPSARRKRSGSGFLQALRAA